MKHFFCIIILYTLIITSFHELHAQQKVWLTHEDNVPNNIAANDQSFTKYDALVDTLLFNVSHPFIQVFSPSKDINKRTAVIICPGGGYHVLLTKREGIDFAKEFASQGVTAIVLNYRLPNDQWMTNKEMVPLQDLQMALKWTNLHADSLAIDADKIGVMGFSAGGHLAALGMSHYRKPLVDPNEKFTYKPDFLILVNPIISFMDTLTHAGSRNNLLGSKINKDLIFFHSNENFVTKENSPTLLLHNLTDEVVPVGNTLVYFDKLRAAGVPTELHVYASGEHGMLTWPPTNHWFSNCIQFLNRMIVKL